MVGGLVWFLRQGSPYIVLTVLELTVSYLAASPLLLKCWRKGVHPFEASFPASSALLAMVSSGLVCCFLAIW